MVLCQNCDKSFSPNREWQLFCCTSCKRSYNYNNREICFYCGEDGVSRDHIHPFSCRPGEQRNFANQETVYACTECNNLLSNNVFPDVTERLDYLILVFERRHKLDKPAAEWNPDEVKELGRSLRSYVKAALKTRQKAEHRLLYMKLVRERLTKALNEEI